MNIIKRIRRWLHYGRKMRVTEMKRWDLEFYKVKLKEVREGQRMEYDRIKETLDAAKTRLEREKAKEDGDKTIKENLAKLIEQQTQDTKNLETQMQTIDNQIEGVGGVNENVSGLITVNQMLRKHRNKVFWE